MNGKTAKLINKLARLSGRRERPFKTTWKRQPSGGARGELREKMEHEVANIEAARRPHP